MKSSITYTCKLLAAVIFLCISTYALANTPPVISGEPEESIFPGSSYLFEPVATDADGDTLTFQILNKPDWASFNSRTGQLRGTPVSGDQGVYRIIRISVTDGRATRFLSPFKITVENSLPVIIGDPGSSVFPGSTYLFKPTASDADGDTLSFQIENKPDWATFNTRTGRLRGVPVSGDQGVYRIIRISVSDGISTRYLSPFKITVENSVPEISGEPDSNVFPGVAYLFKPTATDADGDSLTFEIENKPSWATFNPRNGKLRGVPVSGDQGLYRFIRIGANDGIATRWTSTFRIKVENSLPVISGEPDTVVLAGANYIFTPTSSDADGDRLTFQVRNKPSWASFNTRTGKLKGTPGADDRGLYQRIRIGVSDGIATRWLSNFKVNVANNAPLISGTPQTQTKAGSVYLFQPNATDADGDILRFTIRNRPGWAEFNGQTGVLSGTPDQTDLDTTTGIEIRAIDPNNARAILPAFDLRVVDENFDEPPRLTGEPKSQTFSGEEYRFTPVATYTGDGTLTFSIVNLPSWADFDPVTGELSGTPRRVDSGITSNIVISVDDGEGKTGTLPAFNLEVNASATSYTMAYRLLLQASFGPTEESVSAVMSQGIEAWVDSQLNHSSAYDSTTDDHLSHLERTIQIAREAEPGTDWDTGAAFNQTGESSVDEYQMATWWENALGHPENSHGQDQLRQRVAFALSQLLVVSNAEAPLNKRGEGLALYYDIIARNAFGNFRTLLSEMARSPTMGIYLSHQGNHKSDLRRSISPDENFARELIQLFSIGLYALNTDGSPNRDGDPLTYPDAGDSVVPTYTQHDVDELAKVVTGWDLVGNTSYGLRGPFQGDYTTFMEFTPEAHEDEVEEAGDGQVTLLGETFALNAGPDGSGLDAALDVLFQHENVPPFVSKHLIMRLVSSNPSSDYVARIAAVFENNGDGVRGDLKAVVRAILLDREARNIRFSEQPDTGKIKEPILALTQFLRALNVQPLNGWIGLDEETPVSGVYWYKEPEKDFSQGPLRASSVFNFYSPDFIPSDAYFNDNQLVAPELEIQTGQLFVDMNSRFTNFMLEFEKNQIERISGIPLEEFAPLNSYEQNVALLINFDSILAVYEQALDGDNNGDFSRMELINPVTGLRYKEKAVEALVSHLDQLLLGGQMPDAYREAFLHYLLNAGGSSHNDDFEEAWVNVRDIVRFIVTSNRFMVQK